MSVVKNFWQGLRQRFRRRATSSAGATEGDAAAEIRQRQAAAGESGELQAGSDQQLIDLRHSQQELAGQVRGLQNKLAHAVSIEGQRLAVQQKRLDEVRSQLEAATHETGNLRDALTVAQDRQERAEARVGIVEQRLGQQREQFDAAMQQQLIREAVLKRRLSVALTVAVAAFLLGIVVGVFNFRQAQVTNRLLAEMSRGIRDLGTSMTERLTPPAAYAPSAAEPGPIPDAPEPSPSAADSTRPSQQDALQDSFEQRMPEPDFVVRHSLPMSGNTFTSREATRAFFRENALQPGVIELPGGLQYRELIAGSGRTPVAGDRVVVEYRSFHPDGRELDNSFKTSAPTTMAVDEALSGLKDALLHMQEGAQWELYIPPRLTSSGVRRRGLLGYEPLIMTVELLSVQDAGGGAAP